MNINEVLFIGQFLIILLITLVKIINLMMRGKLYNLIISFSLFFGLLVAYIIGLIITLTDYTYLTYSVLFMLETWLIPVQTLFLLGELILNHINETNKIYTPYEKTT